MIERSKLLQAKLAANAQRREREADLVKLPSYLRAYLESCEYSLSPEQDELASAFNISVDGFFKCVPNEAISQDKPDEILYSYTKPGGYYYAEYGLLREILEIAHALGKQRDEDPAYFSLGWGPLYHVNFGWVRQHVAELFPFSPQSLGVVTKDFAAGFVISNYVGTLEYDSNPDEVVFDLAIWGFDCLQSQPTNNGMMFEVMKAAQYHTLCNQPNILRASILQDTARLMPVNSELQTQILSVLEQDPIPRPLLRNDNFDCDFLDVDLSLVQAQQIIDALRMLEINVVASEGSATAIPKLIDEWMSYHQFKAYKIRRSAN
jgi:hypothetical protein